MKKKITVLTIIRDTWGGGGPRIDPQKLLYAMPLDQAIDTFQKQFGMDIRGSSCGCCGPDFSYYDVDDPDSISYFLNDPSFVLQKG